MNTSVNIEGVAFKNPVMPASGTFGSGQEYPGIPFALSTVKLRTLAKMVREYFPTFETIGCFARITDITPKRAELFNQLHSQIMAAISFSLEKENSIQNECVATTDSVVKFSAGCIL